MIKSSPLDGGGYLFTEKMPWINWRVASAIEARGLSEPRVGQLQLDLV